MTYMDSVGADLYLGKKVYLTTYYSLSAGRPCPAHTVTATLECRF